MNLSQICCFLAKKGIDAMCFLMLLPCFLRRRREIQKDKINKILLINLQGIGDVVMTTPFLIALRAEFPQAEIHYLCYKGNGDLLEGDKRINKIYKRKEDNIFSKDFLNTLKEIRKDNYDLIINQEGPLKTNTHALIEYAFKEKRVIIVSPTSFLAYLQTVMQGLRALQIEDSAKEIRKRVEDLGKHIVAYEEYYKKLGGHLSTTVNTYNLAYKELGKIDKDVVRITDGEKRIEPVRIERPNIGDEA
jgi:ADP-heptose:LPS heptosyltransferase